MKAIGAKELQTLYRPKQNFSDCYLVSTIYALTRSENGKKFLQNNILKENNNFDIKFNNINGKMKDYFISEQDSDNLVMVDKYANPIFLDYQHNPIIKAIEVAMGKLLKEHPSKKPLVSRLAKSSENFEFNKPSNFMTLFTGIKPFTLNEGGIRMSLLSKIDETFNLFKKLQKSDNYSFVAGTGIRFDSKLHNVHCYTVENVDDKFNISFFDNKYQELHKLPFTEVIQKIKFFVGYFNNDLRV